MAQKPIDEDLVLKSLFWTLYQFSRKTDEEKKERPLCRFYSGDGKLVKEAVLNTRMAWSIGLAAHKEGSPAPDFDTIKGKAVDNLQRKHGWTNGKRNLISSAVATYIGFDRGGIAKETERKLKVVMTYAEMFFAPNKT